jgi:uncharacterized protein
MDYTELTTEQRSALLALARQAILARVTGKDFSVQEYEIPAGIDAVGVFVTVRVDSALRGCIGFAEMHAPLDVALADAAARAVSEDSRFEPISPHELQRLRLDVTLLLQQEPLHRPGDISIGTHGIRIDHAGKRGLLLPQVAVEQRWNAEEFLAALCRKARLPEDAWMDSNARLTRFRGIVLREEAEDEMKQEQESIP